MTKLEAIKYLSEHSVYSSEWSGTGMWEAVEDVLKNDKPLTVDYLKSLLIRAENR